MIPAAAINILYALIGGALAIGLMAAGYRIMDAMTAYDTSAELADANMAVALVAASVNIGIALAVGLAVGLGLN